MNDLQKTTNEVNKEDFFRSLDCFVKIFGYAVAIATSIRDVVVFCKKN